MADCNNLSIATAVLDILPNPVLIKDQALRYVWINSAFEQLFSVNRENVIGKLDTDLFPDRQVSQCNGGDLRVLELGEIDESVETVFERSGVARETITRKSKLIVSESEIYLVGVMHDITDVTRANEALLISEAMLQDQALELAVIATTDALTGCFNRRALMSYAANEAEHNCVTQAIVLMDIDKFKSINDLYGHEVGDKTLQHFADLVRSQLSPTDKFYRYGGEEFVLLLEVFDQKEAVEKAERIREHIATTPILVDETSIDYSVSIGLVVNEDGGFEDFEQLLQIADECLYKAKNTGRDRVELAA